jgi:hypothetical protein
MHRAIRRLMAPRSSMQQRRHAFADYVRCGTESLAVPQFFDRFRAREVRVVADGLLLTITPGDGLLFMPWDAYGTELASATMAERQAMTARSHGGGVYGLHWDLLDEEFEVCNMVWDASLPPSGMRAGYVMPRWVSPLPRCIAAWVRPALKAAGRPAGPAA